MQTEGVSPVQAIQELIAMLATRKEAAERIVAKDNGNASNRLKDYPAQTDKYIAELQSELSAFGDAVLGDVDRNNEYQHAWKQALEKLESESPDQLEQRFLKMEQLLKKAYRDCNHADAKLPASLQSVLARQLEALQKAS